MFREKIKNYQIIGKIKSLAINNNKCIYTIKNDSQEVLATIQSAYSLLNRLVFKFELEDTILYFKGTAYFKKGKLVEFEIEDFDIQSLIKNSEIITSDYNGRYNTNCNNKIGFVIVSNIVRYIKKEGTYIASHTTRNGNYNVNCNPKTGA